jgi:hypothetical protein
VWSPVTLCTLPGRGLPLCGTAHPSADDAELPVQGVWLGRALAYLCGHKQTTPMLFGGSIKSLGTAEQCCAGITTMGMHTTIENSMKNEVHRLWWHHSGEIV